MRCCRASSATCARSQPRSAIIDTHAGAGLYDLTGSEASRTGEWRDGIGRLLAAPLAPPVRELLAPYLAAVERLNPGKHARDLSGLAGARARAAAAAGPSGRLRARTRRRPSSRAAISRRDRRAKAVAIDGWTALSAYVPPKERRGLVLIDPPFETAGRIRPAGRRACGRAPQMGRPASNLVVSDQGSREADAFARRLARLGIPKMLRAEMRSRAVDRRAAERQRPDHRQSALDAGTRDRGSCCRRSRRSSRATADVAREAATG